METRERILSYLQENRTATIPLLSQLWGLTRPDIRHHIQQMVKEGLIEQEHLPVLKPAGRGRPVFNYRLSSSSADHNYQDLSAALLRIFFPNYCQPPDPKRLHQLAQQIAVGPVPGTTFLQLLNNLVVWLNERGYHARWEAAVTGPRVLFYHCPYARLLVDHPELCLVDHLVMENLTQQKIILREIMDPLQNGRQACVFEFT